MYHFLEICRIFLHLKIHDEILWEFAWKMQFNVGIVVRPFDRQLNCSFTVQSLTGSDEDISTMGTQF